MIAPVWAFVMPGQSDLMAVSPTVVYDYDPERGDYWANGDFQDIAEGLEP